MITLRKNQNYLLKSQLHFGCIDVTKICFKYLKLLSEDSIHPREFNAIELNEYAILSYSHLRISFIIKKNMIMKRYQVIKLVFNKLVKKYSF